MTSEAVARKFLDEAKHVTIKVDGTLGSAFWQRYAALPEAEGNDTMVILWGSSRTASGTLKIKDNAILKERLYRLNTRD